jgi:hypothetical protein
VRDSENLGARIAKFVVAVVEIRREDVIGAYLYFLEVARTRFGIIFENQRSC